MRLEQAILDRLEKRNTQIAQLQSMVHALERAADSQREHARQENKKLTEQITNARLEREQMQHQIAELRTECDRIREISKSLVPKSALKQAVQEAAELHAEVVKLRAEVPLESTREGLKNAVAKLQEVTTELANLGSYAMTLGRKEGEPLEMFMERQALRLAALESKAGPSIETQAEEIARLNAKMGPLEKLYTTIKKHLDHGIFFSSGAGIYDAVAETAKELSQLTA